MTSLLQTQFIKRFVKVKKGIKKAAKDKPLLKKRIKIYYAATTCIAGLTSRLSKPSIAVSVPEIELGQLPQAPW